MVTDVAMQGNRVDAVKTSADSAGLWTAPAIPAAEFPADEELLKFPLADLHGEIINRATDNGRWGVCGNKHPTTMIAIRPVKLPL